MPILNSGDAGNPGLLVEPEIAGQRFHHAANTPEVGIDFAGNRVKLVAIEKSKSKLARRPDMIAAPSDGQNIPNVQRIG